MEGAKRLVSIFPEHCELNLTKKSGYPEIRLKLRGEAKEAKVKGAQKTRKAKKNLD
jgi:hypothetical protein